MQYVIRLVGLVSGERSEDEARYLCRIEAPAAGERGFLSTTPDPADALPFDTPQAAFEFWHAGPASAFHAAIEPLKGIPRGRPFSRPA